MLKEALHIMEVSLLKAFFTLARNQHQNQEPVKAALSA
jgi:hypothetical protein